MGAGMEHYAPDESQSLFRLLGSLRTVERCVLNQCGLTLEVAACWPSPYDHGQAAQHGQTGEGKGNSVMNFPSRGPLGGDAPVDFIEDPLRAGLFAQLAR